MMNQMLKVTRKCAGTVRGGASAGRTRVPQGCELVRARQCSANKATVSVCLLLQIEQIERKDAPMVSGSTGGVVLGQRRVPFQELRMFTLLGAGGCGPDARCQDMMSPSAQCKDANLI